MFLRFTHVGGVDVIGPWGSISVSYRYTAPTMIPSRCRIGLPCLNRVSSVLILLDSDRKVYCKVSLFHCLSSVFHCLGCPYIVWWLPFAPNQCRALTVRGPMGTCASLWLYVIQRVICPASSSSYIAILLFTVHFMWLSFSVCIQILFVHSIYLSSHPGFHPTKIYARLN